MNPEFSRSFRIDEIGSVPRAVTIAAEEAERAAVAGRFDLIAIDQLEATASLVRNGDAVIATGRLKARVVQVCVASGDPVAAKIDEEFALRFVRAGSDEDIEDLELVPDDLDEITYDGSAVDLGEAVAQTLALALPPFPRAPDADDKLREAGVLGEEDAGPFAALKALKDRLQG